MKIEKNGREYPVKEKATEWEIFFQIGSVTTSYKVKKSDCPTFDDLISFVEEEGIL